MTWICCTGDMGKQLMEHREGKILPNPKKITQFDDSSNDAEVTLGSYCWFIKLPVSEMRVFSSIHSLR